MTSLFGKPAGFGTSAGAFGQSTNTGLFGQSANQTQTQNQPQSNAFGGSLLGQSTQQQRPQQPTASILGASQVALQNKSSLWEPGRESINHKPVTDQIETMVAKWAPNNQGTAFKQYFYNKVDQSRVPFYQPGPGEDPREWEQAIHDKPAPGYIPVLATGFQGIGERLKMQKNVLANYRQALHAINSSLDAILSQNDLQTSVRALNARRKHAILRQRCLALATKVQVLRNRGYSLDKEEDDLKTKLESLDQGLSDPALSARAEELWSRLLLLRGYADTLRTEIDRRGAEASEGLGEEQEAIAKKMLEDFDKQMEHLNKELEKVKKAYDSWQAEGNLPTKN
ncbi:nucleoporin complex subunit 54-domain-containing protein [Xylariaceae sp. FL0016]|nr:nucleoporin complex subunit 54-domain-containing protein [Xylariaceae sp. FL0016]